MKTLLNNSDPVVSEGRTEMFCRLIDIYLWVKLDNSGRRQIPAPIENDSKHWARLSGMTFLSSSAV